MRMCRNERSIFSALGFVWEFPLHSRARLLANQVRAVYLGDYMESVAAWASGKPRLSAHTQVLPHVDAAYMRMWACMQVQSRPTTFSGLHKRPRSALRGQLDDGSLIEAEYRLRGTRIQA